MFQARFQILVSRLHEISDQNIAKILRNIGFHVGQIIDYPDIVE